MWHSIFLNETLNVKKKQKKKTKYVTLLEVMMFLF